MRIDQLTFTRFIASLAIVVFHFGQNVYPFNSHYWNFVFQQASIGVSFFFILSGFVMIIAYGRSANNQINSRKYLLNRMARIYPAYLLALLLFAVQILSNISVKIFLICALMLQAWIPGKVLSYNAPGWTLCVELFFYISFPFLFNYIYRLTNYKRLIAPILIIWLATQAVLNGFLQSHFYKGFPSLSHDLLFFNPLMHINEFLVGNLAGLFFINNQSGKRRNFDLHILTLFILFFLVLKFPSGLNYEDGLLAFIFVPFILLLSYSDGKISSLFKRKAFVFFGEISFGIYIFQVPVYALVNKFCKEFFPAWKDANSLFYISLFILIFFSAVSFLFFETPIREKIKRLKIA